MKVLNYQKIFFKFLENLVLKKNYTYPQVFMIFWIFLFLKVNNTPLVQEWVNIHTRGHYKAPKGENTSVGPRVISRILNPGAEKIKTLLPPFLLAGPCNTPNNTIPSGGGVKHLHSTNGHIRWNF